MSIYLKVNPVKQILLLVRAGQVNSGPPLSPIVGPLGLNARKIAEEINIITSEFKDLKVLIRLSVDRITKAFELSIKNVSTATLFLKFQRMNKGMSDRVSTVEIDKKTLEEFKEFADQKKDIVHHMASVIGTLRSIGVLVK
jgi:ribosomal protein L11